MRVVSCAWSETAQSNGVAKFTLVRHVIQSSKRNETDQKCVKQPGVSYEAT